MNLQPPVTGYLILAIAIVWTAVYQFLRTRLVDIDKREHYMRELRRLRELYSEARKTGDPKLYAKLQKEMARFQLIQQEVSKESMKEFSISIFSLIIFIALLNIIGRGIVIVAPFNIVYIPFLTKWMGQEIYVEELGRKVVGFTLIGWYFLGAFTLGSLTVTIHRLLRVKKKLERASWK